jgi:hypothetical protein
MLIHLCLLLQDIKLSEVTQKMAELEMRMAQEMAPLWALKVQGRQRVQLHTPRYQHKQDC